MKLLQFQLRSSDISVSRIFESQMDMFFFFLPVSTIRKWLRKYYLKQISYEIEKNIHRHISILTERIYQVLDSYKSDSSRVIEDELGTLQKLINSKVELEKPYEVIVNELTEIVNQLNLK